MYELDVIAADSLGRFVARWYGLPDRPRRDLPGTPDLLPEPLAEWHRVAARYSLPLSRDHVMIDPADLVESGGLVRFWAGVDDWYSYAPSDSAPSDSVPGHSASGDSGHASGDSGPEGFAHGDFAHACGAFDPLVIENDTVSTGVPLSRFLVYAAVYEATYTPLHGLVYMSPAPAELRQVRLRLRELDDPLWRWPDPATRYYGDDDLLGHLGPDRIVLAARHRDALGRFDGLGLPWDWDTRTV
ncbi:hypothetical protein ACFO1B_36055 [Dactylosporangium siamense]|uniref:Uncharacterized protein n=1 Tax=Dactylosporangium siamense TaxID=685454 RepID=A0A919PJJ1_9ACTN|nr:hypothetical protein [Dactylosporangium siamense]GIG45990.1 hypothetical protein Dsi01nite_040310 [Dactylosporangium siamense]